ncbi:MAG: MlaD family protein [Candidatus Muiribacteriota bacterium]
MNKSFISGIFVFLALIILSVMIFYVDDIGVFLEKKHIFVLFDHANTLTDGSLVYYNGVNVGSVGKISFYNRKVKVRLSLKQDVDINENAIISINTGGLIGEKYIDIEAPSDLSGRILEDGETIMGVEGQSIEKLIYSINNLSEEISKTFSNMNKMLEKNEKYLTNFVENIDETSRKMPNFLDSVQNDLSSASKEFSSLMSNLDGNFSELPTDLKSLIISIRDTSNRLNNILKSVEDKKEYLGESIENAGYISRDVREISQNVNKFIKEDLPNVQSFFKPFSREEFFTEYETSYSKNSRNIYSDFYVNFLQNENKFALMGIERIGYENDFSFVLGRYFNKHNYYFGGVINSRPGIGFGYEQKPLIYELFNTDINNEMLNLKINYDINSDYKFGIEYIDFLNEKDFEFSIKRKL